MTDTINNKFPTQSFSKEQNQIAWSIMFWGFSDFTERICACVCTHRYLRRLFQLSPKAEKQQTSVSKPFQPVWKNKSYDRSWNLNSHPLKLIINIHVFSQFYILTCKISGLFYLYHSTDPQNVRVEPTFGSLMNIWTQLFMCLFSL